MALSALAACATTGEGAADQAAASQAATSARPQHIDREARERITRADMLTQMAFWAGEYNAFPNDLEAARRFSDSLRKGGRAERAAQVANDALARFPDDQPLLYTLGVSQLAAQKPQEALRPLALVAQADPQNWRTRSALGAALDQLGRYDDARRAYQEALAIHPDDPGVLTNLGVSHLMSGDAEGAEPILRQAAALPQAPPEARANLAIALALAGRFQEAEQLQRVDLPPAQAQANVTYLRGLLSDPRRWGDLNAR
ncbi:flp pilus assembly protein TadD [alpha proteobacterium U9-1i]|nr:flp pilus assembly protein TadD [alpha proteobacterium U9-1i]